MDKKRLDEWKVAMENARHFNDLLMRLRMLGLPMVITLSVVGIASMQFISKIEIGKCVIPLILLSTAIVGLIALIWHTIQKRRPSKSKEGKTEESNEQQKQLFPIYWLEFVLWLIFVGVASYFSVTSLYNLIISKEPWLNPTNYSLMPVTLLAAVVLLTSLYILDRFYYYKLLIGAVRRLTELEEELGFEITARTSQVIPPKYSTNIVTLFYCLPGIILLMLACVSSTS
jgi:hypothetical protein